MEDFLLRTNVYTLRTGRQLNIQPLRELGNAATDTNAPSSAGKGRAVAYKNEPEYMRFHLPMPHRFLPVYQDGTQELIGATRDSSYAVNNATAGHVRIGQQAGDSGQGACRS